MADEAARPVAKGFEDILANDEKELDEELARAKAGEAPSEPADTEPAPQPAGAAPEPTEPAVAPPTPPTPPAPVAEPEKKGGEGEPWRLLRMKERELKATQEAKERFERLANEYEAKLRGQSAPAQQEVPTFEADPAMNLKHGVESVAEKAARLETEQQALRAQIAQQAELQAVQAQEQAFSREHPDYPQAIQHLVDSELKEFRIGLKPAMVARLNRALMGGNEQIKQVVDEIAATGMNEDAAISEIAERSYINSRVSEVREAARVMGKSAPELGYMLAQLRGWGSQPAPAQVAPAPQQQPAPVDPALARVRQAQQISRASQTLSEMDTSAPPSAKKYTRQDVLNMDDRTLDAMLAGDDQSWYR